MSRARQLGTAAETAVVNYLRQMGFRYAERRALSGGKDRGDITGIPGVVIEVKNCGTMKLAEWMTETENERENARALIGVCWAKRRGKGSPGEWYVIMTGQTFVDLLAEND